MTSSDREWYDGYSVDDEDQLEPLDTLDDSDVADEMDRGYSPPEHYSAAQGYGTTPWEARHPRPLTDRLAEEEPEPDPAVLAGEERDEVQGFDAGIDEVGTTRAGRLISPDRGEGPDEEAQLLALDIGIDGAAASAEEAAVHVIGEGEA